MSLTRILYELAWKPASVEEMDAAVDRWHKLVQMVQKNAPQLPFRPQNLKFLHQQCYDTFE